MKKQFLLLGVLATALIVMGCTDLTDSETEGDAAVSAFNLSALVTAPVRDAAPVTTAIDTTQYTGSVAWQTSGGAAFNGAAFAAGTVYKALVTLSVKSGYTFTGLAENSFAYTGATAVSNAANSGTVTITFPATEAVGSANITVGFAYGAITITGSNGSNVISRNGTDDTPTSLTLSAEGYTDVVWYVDGNTESTQDNGTGITLEAADYTGESHFVTFTGKKDGVPYSQEIPFQVIQ
jgi:hypothetical protein